MFWLGISFARETVSFMKPCLRPLAQLQYVDDDDDDDDDDDSDRALFSCCCDAYVIHVRASWSRLTGTIATTTADTVPSTIGYYDYYDYH